MIKSRLPWSFWPACCSSPVELGRYQQSMLAGARCRQLPSPSMQAQSCTITSMDSCWVVSVDAVAVLSVPSSLSGLSNSLYSQAINVLARFVRGEGAQGC